MSARGASSAGACAAWCVAVAPFVLAESTLAGVSRTALAALPWIAWAGLPSASPDRGAQAMRTLAFEIALFLPPLALGAWIDLALGLEPADVAKVAGSSFVLACILALAARTAQRTPGGLSAFTAAWFAAVALGPVLEGALRLGGAPRVGSAPRWLEFAAAASPLGWIARALDARGPAPDEPWAAVGVALALLALAFLAARSNPEGEQA